MRCALSTLALLLLNTASAQLSNTTTTNVTVAPSNETSQSPSFAPSLAPSLSNAPSFSPTTSSRPTSNPTISPSGQPTISKRPSSTPTISSIPSSSPSGSPKISPIIPPSAAPSMEEVVEIFTEFTQLLKVAGEEVFDEGERSRFCVIYESVTPRIGYMDGTNIETKCNVEGQSILYTRNRRRRMTLSSILGLEVLDKLLRRALQQQMTSTLKIGFSMTYSTKDGRYDIDNYGKLFEQYVNSNTTQVMETMVSLDLPVVEVNPVLMLQARAPTAKPTMAPQVQTNPPTKQPVVPTVAPSPQKPSFIDIPEVSQNSFVVGLSLGLSGAFAVAAFGFLYYRHLEKNKNSDSTEMELAGDNNDMDIGGTGGGDSMEVKTSEHHHGGGILSMSQDDDMIINADSDNDDDGGVVRELQSAPPRMGNMGGGTPLVDIESGTSVNNTDVSASAAPMVHPFAHATMDSMFSQESSQQAQMMQMQAAQGGQYQEALQQAQMQMQAQAFEAGPTNLMMADASFSSDSDDDLGNPSAYDGSHDELDNYRNQDLEILRNTVEEAVEDVEGMLSLAMTRALTEADDTILPWGSEDSGSIEASCLFETYDWLKRNEKSPLATRLVVLRLYPSLLLSIPYIADIHSLFFRYEFFQEVINGVVLTVLFGFLHPLEAAQLAHGVATVIGLPLLKDFHLRTLVITGMRKTNDVARGQHVILAAFERFGPIEQAAIAAGRGFGFVRFAKPKSVQRALEKYRVAEIEIQDVSVSIKTLSG